MELAVLDMMVNLPILITENPTPVNRFKISPTTIADVSNAVPPVFVYLTTGPFMATSKTEVASIPIPLAVLKTGAVPPE